MYRQQLHFDEVTGNYIDLDAFKDRYDIKINIQGEVMLKPKSLKRYVKLSSPFIQRALSFAGLDYDDYTVEAFELSPTEMVVYNDTDTFRDELKLTSGLVPQIRTLINGEYHYCNLSKTVRPDASAKDLKQFLHHTRVKLTEPNEYCDTNETSELQFVTMPIGDVELPPLFNGDINCVIQSVLPFCRFATQRSKLMAYESVIHNTGATSKVIQNISDIVKHNISIRDVTNHTWLEFLYHDKKRGHIILYAHDNHCFAALDKTNLRRKLEIVFADKLKLSDHRNAYRITKNKQNQISSITTDTTVYKLKFDEWDNELYKNCFGDAGVGKKKFLQQFPEFRHNKNSPDVFKFSNRPPLYVRTGVSSLDNIKYDQNQSFRSFYQSGCFMGFPSSLDQVFRVPKLKLSRLLAILPLNELHGLIYIKSKTVQLEDFYECNQIYYEKEGFYDIHICLSLLENEKIDPIVTVIALSKNAFNPDFSEFTKQQFRAFVGRTTSKKSSTTYITQSRQEALHLMYRAGDNLLSSNIKDTINTNQPITIEVQDSAETLSLWQMFQIGSYVKQHQKLALFRTINKLHRAGIKIINITTDSIEVTKSDAVKICDNDILSIHPTNIGCWKREPVKSNILKITRETISIDNEYEQNGIVSQDGIYFRDFKMLNITPDTTSDAMKALCVQFNQFLFITGSAGTGKTQEALMLPHHQSLCAGTYVYLVPENDLISTLRKKANELGLGQIEIYTYHSYFGIGTRPCIRHQHTTFIFEEISKIPAHQFDTINKAMMDFYNTDKPFADKRIVLVGDFDQLPPVAKVGNHSDLDCRSLRHSALFKLFTTRRLKVNHRQSSDPAFYNVLESLRNKASLSHDELEHLLETINSRVIDRDTLLKKILATETDQSSAIILGTHEAIKRVDKLFKYDTDNLVLKVGMKVISTKKHNTCNTIIHNGAHGYIYDINIDKHGVKTFMVDYDQTKVAYSGNLPQSVILGTSMTIHRVQGKTYTGDVIFNPTSLFEKNHLYVAMSRATRLDNIYLTEKLSEYTFIKC